MTKNVPNKIPKPNVVEGPKPVLDENNPDTVWLSPDKYLKVKAGTISYDNYTNNISGLSGGPSNLNSLLNSSRYLATQDLVKPDTIDLSDIESVNYEQYYDPISKLVKYKAIIKIRNSSVNKTSVEGVDARIYNPNA